MKGNMMINGLNLENLMICTSKVNSLIIKIRLSLGGIFIYTSFYGSTWTCAFSRCGSKNM